MKFMTHILNYQIQTLSGTVGFRICTGKTS